MTARQEEVLHPLLQGKDEKTIAKELGLSTETVHVHIKAIYAQGEVHSRGELFAKVLSAISPAELRQRLAELGLVSRDVLAPGRGISRKSRRPLNGVEY